MVIGYRGVYPDSYGPRQDWGPWFGWDLPTVVAKPLFLPVVYVGERTVGGSIFTFRLLRRLHPRVLGLYRERFHHDPDYPHKKATRSRNRPSWLAEHGPIEALPYEIVSMIARNVHHADLVSASQSFRLLRGRLFGTGDDVVGRLNALREVSCQPRKSTCSVCRSQVCPVSALPLLVPMALPAPPYAR